MWDNLNLMGVIVIRIISNRGLLNNFNTKYADISYTVILFRNLRGDVDGRDRDT